MPRQKKLDIDTPAEQAPETKPVKSTRKPKVEEAVAAFAEVVSEPAQTKPARSRSKKQTALPEVEPVNVVQAKPKTSRKAASKSTDGIAEPETPGLFDAPADVSKKAAARTKTKRLAEPAPLPVIEEKPNRGARKGVAKVEIAPEPRSRPSRAKSAKPESKAAKQTSAPEGEEDLPVPIWRPRTKPAKSERPPREARGRGKKAETPRPLEPSTQPAQVRESAKKAVRPLAVSTAIDEDIEDAPIIEWRSLKGKEPATKRDAPEKRERRERRGSERPERPPITEPQATKPDLAPRDVPTRPTRQAVPFPDDAPQVVLLEGKPTLVRNHRVYPPLFFFGNPSDERRAQTVMEEMRMAADAGVHLHAHLVELQVNENTVADAVGFAGFLLKKSLEVDPDAQVLFRVVFTAPYGWEDKYPDARFRSGHEPSLCDDAYWGVAEACLTRFVKQLRQLDQRDSILGVHLDRGEWFLPDEAEYDDSKAARNMFRDWARTRYLNDEVTLRASWFDGSARFDNITVPPYRPEGDEGEKFVRSSRKQRKYVDYHLFLSDATVQRIGDLAYAAKQASDGYFLVGASYGYTFEWSHPASGHLSLGKLLRTPDIDFIAGPPSYRTREPGGAASFPGPIDSYALNGKLYISEEDFKTSLAVGHEPDDFNPQLRTPQALENVHWRGAGAAVSHASGLSWMDLWGNGWLKTPSVWERASKVLSSLISRMDAPLGDPDVAVFIDERALAYLVDPHAFQLLVQNVRESVLRAGVNAGFYLLSDLAHREKFPESKLYLFLNAWDIRPDLRAAIKSRLQRDNKVLFWLYSAGLFDAGRDSLERAREVTGIALKPQPFHSKSGTTILNRRHPLSEAFPDKTLYSNTQLEPSYFAIPEGATVLGEYSQTGLPSFVVKEHTEGAQETHWTSVFLGEPQVNPALIRALATMAGVHVWNYQDDVVHVRPPFCTVHCTGPGPRTIALPSKFTAYNLLTGEWAYDAHNLRFSAPDGSTHALLVGPRDELQHLLDLDPATKLRIDKLPPRELNVLHDASTFDVPIMKLDEWMGGTDNDEVADEWFLRAPVMQEEPEQALESDRGRRRRKRRGPRERGEEDVVVRQFEEEIGLGVMFRKKS